MLEMTCGRRSARKSSGSRRLSIPTPPLPRNRPFFKKKSHQRPSSSLLWLRPVSTRAPAAPTSPPPPQRPQCLSVQHAVFILPNASPSLSTPSATAASPAGVQYRISSSVVKPSLRVCGSTNIYVNGSQSKQSLRRMDLTLGLRRSSRRS